MGDSGCKVRCKGGGRWSGALKAGVLARNTQKGTSPNLPRVLVLSQRVISQCNVNSGLRLLDKIDVCRLKRAGVMEERISRGSLTPNLLKVIAQTHKQILSASSAYNWAIFKLTVKMKLSAINVRQWGTWLWSVGYMKENSKCLDLGFLDKVFMR